MQKLVVLLASCLALAACAVTKIDSQRLPTAAAQQPFTSLFAFNADMELGHVKTMEKTMGEEFAKTNVTVQLGLAHLRYDATREDVFAKAAELQTEGLLVVVQEDLRVETSTTPGYWVAATKEAPGYYVPATTTQTHIGRFSGHLYSLRTKDKPEEVWIADIQSSSALAGLRGIYEDVGSKVVRKLVEDGMITARTKK